MDLSGIVNFSSMLPVQAKLPACTLTVQQLSERQCDCMDLRDDEQACITQQIAAVTLPLRELLHRDNACGDLPGMVHTSSVLPVRGGLPACVLFAQ